MRENRKLKNVGTGFIPVRGQPQGLSLQKRKNPRLKGFDYSLPYAYFITICSKDKINFFTDPVFNKNVIECLISEKIRNNLLVYAYCLMPDHLHLLVSPDDSRISVSRFIGGFKSKSTRLAWERGIDKLWQNRFYDHILRKREDLNETAQYILNNPIRKGMVQAYKEYEFSGIIDEIPL